MPSKFMIRTIPLALAVVTAMTMLVDLFIVSPPLNLTAGIVRDYAMVLFGFSVIVGAGNIIRYHLPRIVRRERGQWYFSILLMVTMASMAITGLSRGASSLEYGVLYDTVNNALAQGMTSLLAFYIFSAAVRAFVARNYEALFFLIAGSFAIIGNIPSMVIWAPSLATIGPWLLDNPSKGGITGIMIAASIAAIIMIIRTLAGRERGFASGA